MNTTINLLNGLEFLYPDNIVVSQMKRTLDKFPECESFLVDAFSLGQLKSKMWLIDNIPDNLGSVFICAGWYGTLASLMFERCPTKFRSIRSFDIDPTCAPIADNMNRPWVMDGWKFKASTADIHDIEYPYQYKTQRANGTTVDLNEMPDTIINTSCEHIENFSEWYSKIPNGKIVILQSNDFEEVEEHVNCYKSLDHFDKDTPMKEIIFLGELSLPKYNRFMKIGIK